jgi:wyosine [tRNA(Phe)-imidazoG37] synthetase (radical SAM superfamily)
MKSNFIENGKITNKFVETYTKTTYRIVGPNKHSAIKPCHWLEQKLLTGRLNRNCYKGVFGVESHRCLQNTPSLPFCNHQCVFCWRDIELGALGGDFIVDADNPKEIIDEMIRHQQDILKNHLPLRRYLENYEVMTDILYYMLINKQNHNINSLSKNLHISKNKIQRAINLLKNQTFIRSTDILSNNYKIDSDISCCIDSREEIQMLINRELTTPEEIIQTHYEALTPNHAAISLDGEPLLYPKIDEYIQEFRNRGMTTFIVSNGTLPKTIEGLSSLPSQLYITLPASNEGLYKKACRPMIKDGWNNLNETLGLLSSLSCRTVIRLTAVKNLNLSANMIPEYTKLIEKANPTFIEIKGFTLQAKALLIENRLKSQKPLQYYFPDYDYLHQIALKFEELSGFPLIYTNKASRDFLFAVNWDEKDNPKIVNP